MIALNTPRRRLDCLVQPLNTITTTEATIIHSNVVFRPVNATLAALQLATELHLATF